MLMSSPLTSIPPLISFQEQEIAGAAEQIFYFLMLWGDTFLNVLHKDLCLLQCKLCFTFRDGAGGVVHGTVSLAPHPVKGDGVICVKE